MKNLILSATCLLAGLTLFGQTPDHIEFNYDDSGNRTERNVIYLRVPEDGKALEVEGGEPPRKLSGAEGREKKSSSTVVYNELIGEQQISIFPNPTKGKLTIEITNLEPDKPASLEVYSLTGEMVLHKNKIRNKTVVDLSKFPTGTYILKIQTSSGVQSWKVVKE